MPSSTTQSGQFTVPANQPTGTVEVEVIGSQGSRGTTTYTGQHNITTQQRRTVTTVVYNYDPLAETFTMTEGRHIGGIDLWFKNAGKSRVVVQIRDTLVGFPSKNVLAQASIYPEDIKTDGTPTRLTFRPIWLEANEEYAIVILTDDAETAVSVCELGQYDTTHQTYVTKQAYQAGVLLSSSNASTWTTHQTMDLAFRLLACKFTEANYTFNLGSVNADNHTDLLVLSNIERVSNDTDAEFVVTDSNGKSHTLAEDATLELREVINGATTLQMKIRGNSKQSPVIYKGVQLMLGKQAETADYVTRSITAGTNTTIRVMFDSYTPGNSAVKVYYQQQDNTWTLIPLNSGSNIGDGLEERTYLVEGFNGSSTRIKLVLEGNVLYRPYVKNLRVITI